MTYEFKSRLAHQRINPGNRRNAGFRDFYYCDPSYYETEGHYAVVFRKEDHKRLRDTLASCKGKWMVSYND